MIKDIQTIIWKEWKEFFFQQTGRNKLRLLLAFAIIGIILPVDKGLGLFNSIPFYISSIMIGPLLMLTSVVCDLFVGERERHTLETLLASRLTDKSILLGKVLSAISYSLAITIFILVLNISIVNLKYYNGTFIILSFTTGITIIGINILLSLLGALIGVGISFKISTVKVAQQTLSISIVVLIFILITVFQKMPDNIRFKIIETLHSLGTNKSILLICVWLAGVDLILLIVMFSYYKRMKLFID